MALRVWAYNATLGTPTADEAVVGLMARHAAHGELTTFYWGQAYGGTQEVLLTVPVFWIAGSSWFALRLVPIALTVLATFLIWRVGRRLFGAPAGAVAAAVLWIWPPFAVYQLTHAMGFYASDIVYSLLLVLLALRVEERPDRRRVAELGLVAGLAFWQTAQIVPIAAGVIAWTIWKRPQSLRHVWVGALGAGLGALPLISWNVRHDWASMSGIDGGAVFHSLRLLASPALPMLVGLRVPFSARLLLPAALTYLAYVGVVALFVFGAYKARHRRASILYLVTAIFPFVYALSPKTALALSTPRFIIVLVPILALLLAQFATTTRRGVVVLAVVCVVSVVTLHRMEDWFRGVPRPTTQARGLGPRDTVQLVPRDLGVLVRALHRLRLDHVYTDYWLAYRLDFDTKERVTAVENRLLAVSFDGREAVPAEPLAARYPPFARAVLRSDHGFVFYSRIVATAAIVPRLQRHGYRRHDAGPFVILAPPTR